MPLYRVDLVIYGTAYVRAKTMREAHKIVDETYSNGGAQLSHEDVNGDMVDSFGIPNEMPDLSLGPELTISHPVGINRVERV